MAKQTKKDILRQAVKTEPKKLTEKERESLGKKLLSQKSELKKALFVIESEDLEWLDTTVADLKRTRRRSNKSEIIKLGISLLKEKSQEELKELLKGLD